MSSGGTFVPPAQYISNISNALQAVVTFPTQHDFSVGEIVSFRVSPPYAMQQLNNVSAAVLATSTYTITVGIDTRNSNSFVSSPSGTITYPAMVVPAGTGIVPGQFLTSTSLTCVFDDLPPNSS